MPIRRVALITCLLGFIGFCASGCVMQRTVKEGDAVVAKGLVVKSPLMAP